jgi:hypothetical protein
LTDAAEASRCDRAASLIRYLGSGTEDVMTFTTLVYKTKGPIAPARPIRRLKKPG